MFSLYTVHLYSNDEISRFPIENIRHLSTEHSVIDSGLDLRIGEPSSNANRITLHANTFG